MLVKLINCVRDCFQCDKMYNQKIKYKKDDIKIEEEVDNLLKEIVITHKEKTDETIQIENKIENEFVFI